MIRLKLSICKAVVFFSISGSYAQQATSAAGGDATGSGGTSSFTVGQVTYTTNTGSMVSIAQGVQQPYEISTSIGNEVSEITLDLEINPNPTADVLWLNTINYANNDLTFQLYDSKGKLLDHDKINKPSISIDMQDRASSIYILRVMGKNKLIKSFRIIKN